MKKLLITLIVLILVSACPIYFLLTKPSDKFYEKREDADIRDYVKTSESRDRIHFLSTGSSDAILLESDGRFALIDSGEDTDNPRGFPDLELEGFEEKVISYLKDNAADTKGKVHLDFILGTHAHSDHIGGFDTIIKDDDIVIERAYLKEYNSSLINDMENEEWDNQEVYDQMLSALSEKKIPVIQNLDEAPFAFGNFTLTFLNAVDPPSEKKVGENDNAVGLLIEKKGTKIFLAADINNESKDEDRLCEKISKVNLLKVGHHSYSGSTTSNWLKTLMPDTCIVTNHYDNIDTQTINRIIRIADSTVFITGQENGIVAEISDGGKITYYGKIH